MLLSRYFREELKQRIWGRGLSQEGPIRSCLVTLVIFRLVSRKACHCPPFISCWPLLGCPFLGL